MLANRGPGPGHARTQGAHRSSSAQPGRKAKDDPPSLRGGHRGYAESGQTPAVAGKTILT